MEVLLRQDVPKVGRRGQVVRVASGFGRNYLIPRGLATTVTQANVKLLEQEAKKYEAKEAKRKEELKKVAEALDAHSVTIEAKANDEGHLFGSVTYDLILKAFQADGFELEERQLELENPEKIPIKEVGIYSIKILLHPEITAFSKVWVVEDTSDKDDDKGAE